MRVDGGVLKKLQRKEKWASVFRFNSLCLEDIYTTPLFEGRLVQAGFGSS